MSNYIKLKRGLRYTKYLYVDLVDRASDEIFIRKHVPVGFERAPISFRVDKTTEYCAVFCKVKNKHREVFESAMYALKLDLLLAKRGDYTKACEWALVKCL